MGLPEEEIAKVRTAAAVHDVGKARTPRSVLNKPGKLNAVQQQLMNRHAIDGAKMAESIGDAQITAMVRHHHERLDGRGYPDGLSGDEIPLGARIIAVADTFDAMTSARAYRSAMRHSRALKILRKEAGAQLDPAAVTAFTEYYAGQRSVAWWAIWTTAPQRLAAWIGSLLNTTGAASLSQSVAAIGTAAAIAGGAAETTRQHERDPHRASSAAAYSAPAYHPSGGAEISEEAIPETLPQTVSTPAPAPGERSRKGDGGSPERGIVAHPGGTDPVPAPKAPKGQPGEPKPERDQSGGSKAPKKEADPIDDVVATPGKGNDKPRNPNAKPKPEPVEAPAPAPPKDTGPKNPKGP
jgi:hypothetical protein